MLSLKEKGESLLWPPETPIMMKLEMTIFVICNCLPARKEIYVELEGPHTLVSDIHIF